MNKFKKMITHLEAHIDEKVAVFIIKMLSEEILGYLLDKLETIGKGIITNPEEDVLYIGTGHCDLDEHRLDGRDVTTNESKSKKEKSAALMAAEFLSISNNPKYRSYMKLVKYAHTNDRNGSANMLELGNILKNKYILKYSDQSVWSWTFDVLKKKMNSLNNIGEYKKFSRKIIGEYSREEYVLEILKFKPSRTRKKRFVLRENFSINDSVFISVAQRFGYSVFGVNNNTPIIFVNPANYKPQSGDLCVGFGNADYAKFPLKKFTKSVRFYKYGDYSKIIKFISQINNARGYNPFALDGLLVDRLFSKEETSLETLNWIKNEINDSVDLQRKINNANREYHEGFKNEKVHITSIYVFENGKKVKKKAAFILSSNSKIASIAFSERGFSCDVVVIKNGLGNITIQTTSDPKRKIKIPVIMKKLWLNEYRLTVGDEHAQLKDMNLLMKNGGSSSQCPQWHYQKETESGFNGSFTHPDVKPSQIPFSEIENIVVDGVRGYYKYLSKKNNTSRI